MKNLLQKLLFFIILIVVSFLFFYVINPPPHQKLAKQDAVELRGCIAQALAGDVNQAYALVYRNELSPYENDNQKLFWYLIYLENLKFNLNQIAYDSEKDIVKNKKSVLNFYEDTTRYYNQKIADKKFYGEIYPNNFEKMMYSDNRIEYWKFFLTNKNLHNLFITDNNLNENNLQKIKINAELGNGEDAFFLYNYYKVLNPKDALVWLQISAENGFELGQKVFLSKLKMKNKDIYAFINFDYNFLGKEKYDQFENNRIIFWDTVINHKKFPPIDKITCQGLDYQEKAIIK